MHHFCTVSVSSAPAAVDELKSVLQVIVRRLSKKLLKDGIKTHFVDEIFR